MRAVVAALLVALVVALPIGLGAGNEGCDGAVTGILVLDNAPAPYLADRGDGGLWLYAESSGVPGLQPGGRIVGVIVDPCGEPATSDTLLAHVPSI